MCIRDSVIRAVRGGSAGHAAPAVLACIDGMDAGLVSELFDAGAQAVSYTHLDVYKRQGEVEAGDVHARLQHLADSLVVVTGLSLIHI